MSAESLRIGGDRFDSAMIRYIRDKDNLIIGEKTAEEIKVNIGAAYVEEDKEYEVRGRKCYLRFTENLVMTSRRQLRLFPNLLNASS